MFEKDEGSKPYALQLVEGIKYKGSIDIIQLKRELLTYSISPDLTFLIIMDKEYEFIISK